MQKIKILNKKENFEKVIYDYLLLNSKDFAREEAINEIFSENLSLKEKIQNLKIEIYGSTYQGHNLRNSLNPAYASHKLVSIIFEEDEIFGLVEFLDTPIGRPLRMKNNSQLNLIPIYDSEDKLTSFDLDLNINFTNETESYSYTIK